MDWRAYYKEHTMTPEQAVGVIHDGDRVVFGHAVGEPIVFQRTMARMAEQFHNVEVAHMVYLGSGEYLQPGMESHFRHNALFVGGPARKPIAENRADYTPAFFSDVPRMFRDNTLPVDVFAFTCSPPDERGYVSLGLSCDYGAQAVKSAKTVIAEVNPNMPRTYGESFVHVSEIDGFLCSWEPLPESAPPKIGEEDRAIGKYIAELVRDGDCLQLGIGGMPNTVGALIAESDLKDLGVHTEMYVDAFVDIAKAGKINGKNKSLDYGRQVYAFAAGTKKMYDYVNMNPEVMGAPVDYTNDVRVIAQLDNFISINNIVDLDLFGQVNAESAGIKQISGTGGQLDFVMGAYLSKGGKSFICLSSAMKGKDGQLKSRIVPTLTPGSICTDPRSTVQYLVTEYGMINLKGLNTWERADKIISIAHPQFREDLIKDAEKMGIWRRSNKR